jgi:hypothetical protein
LRTLKKDPYKGPFFDGFLMVFEVFIKNRKKVGGGF